MWIESSKFVSNGYNGKMDRFKIRTYGKGELAQLYCPYLSTSAARRKLMQWIELQPRLVEILYASGLTEHSKSFTPIQVKYIVEALGEP